MTIQLSVTLWTVICFLLLTVILKKLLFKPILEVMDKRKEKLEKAQGRKAEIERLKAEYESELESERLAACEAQEKKVKEEIELIRAQSKAAVEKADAERLAAVEKYRKETELQAEAILGELGSRSEEIARLFADALTED